jgi:predicted DNA binding CopG/RHH family protein
MPEFQSEREEREFWETHDSTGYADWSGARIAVFPNLKPSTETISLRLPSALLSELRALANRRDVPYQSLLKVFLAERVARETSGRLALPNKALQPPSRARRSGAKPKKRARAARG